MKLQSPLKRKFPKVLAEKLRHALGTFIRMGISPDEMLELLAQFRKNRSKSIAVWGIANVGTPVLDLSPIPILYRDALKELDEAYSELHNFQNGGAEDYCAASITLLAEKKIKSERAKFAADARHSKPDGSREKRAKICSIWATGKYTFHTKCAEQESDALGMAYDTAMEALKNAPEPSRPLPGTA
jgi:hypothetical protein